MVKFSPHYSCELRDSRATVSESKTGNDMHSLHEDSDASQNTAKDSAQREGGLGRAEREKVKCRRDGKPSTDSMG